MNTAGTAMSTLETPPVPASSGASLPLLPIIQWTKSLLDLDDDSLYLAILALRDRFIDSPYTRVEVALAPLSLVNKRLRGLTIPLMFRDGYSNICKKNRSNVLGMDLKRGFYPSHLWQYFKTFHVLQGDMSLENLEFSISAFPHMTNVTVLIVKVQKIPSWNFLMAAARIPSLIHLELKIRRMDTPEPMPYDHFSNLRKLVISEGLWPMERDEDQRVLERRNVSLLLTANHATLRHLELPGQIADLFELSTLQWPNLEYFALNGYVPPAPHPPISHLLRNMARLRDLRLKFLGKDRWDRSRHGAQVLDPDETFQQPPYEISPANEEPPYTYSLSQNRLDQVMPQLKSLVVTYVSQSDRFFHYLPPALESLCLICSPPATRGGHYRVDWPLSEEKCLAVVATLSGVPLKKLHITHKAETTSLALLKRITEVLPRIESLFLEAQHFHDSGKVNLDDYIATLIHFPNLTDLRISLPFNSLGRIHAFAADPHRAEFVTKLAWAMPVLSYVGLRQWMSHGRNVLARYPPFSGWEIIRPTVSERESGSSGIAVRRSVLDEDY